MFHGLGSPEMVRECLEQILSLKLLLYPTFSIKLQELSKYLLVENLFQKIASHF